MVTQLWPKRVVFTTSFTQTDLTIKITCPFSLQATVALTLSVQRVGSVLPYIGPLIFRVVVHQETAMLQQVKYLPLLTSKGFYWKSSLDTLISLSSICVVAFLLHLLFSHASFLLPSYESITEESKKDMSNSRVNRNKCLLHKNHNVSTSWLIVGFPTTLCDNMITLILTTAPTCKSTELAILFPFYRWSVQS